MGWLHHDSASKSGRVTYYPLQPGRIWFQVDWVNPTFRGRGLHKNLFYQRAVDVQTILGDAAIEANVDPRNSISLHNCEKAGFGRQCMLHVLSLGGRNRCWRSHLSL